MNVVTPSGGNEFHGDVFSFFSADELRTTPRYGLSQTNLDNFTQFDVGGSLGGPMVRDHLWFFGAYNPILDIRDASFPGISVEKDRQVQHRFAGKLTWQPSASTRAVLTSTGDPTVHDGVAPNPDFGNAACGPSSRTASPMRARVWATPAGGHSTPSRSRTIGMRRWS